MKKINLIAIAAIMLVAMSISACSKNIKADNGLSKQGQQISGSDIDQDSQTDITDEDLQYGELDIRDFSTFESNSGLKPVPFNFDKYDLSAEALEIIKDNAALLKANRQWKIAVEGHCDNRGTMEYNLSLGQKRANAVRDHYVRLGVKSSRIGTISYGAENQICFDETEACWQTNRRAETKVK